MKPIKGNVVDNELFNPRMCGILDYVATAISKTLGPYGHKALIQTSDNVVSTKDGWNVLQYISFDNIIDNAIKSMIESVAHSVVLKVGDGTTTSVHLTNELLTSLENFHIENYTIRDIEESLRRVVNRIEQQLRLNAKDINKDNLHDTIYNVAMVSSNWNEEMSSIIADIYSETNNPIIKVQDSGTDKTTVDFINGYDLSGNMVTNTYINNFSDKTCEIKNPLIVILNFQITDKYFTSLSLLGNICLLNKRELVVLSPGFDTAFISHLNNANNISVNNKNGLINLVPVKIDNKFVIDRECIEDFSILTGAVLISKNDTDIDIDEFFDSITSTMTKMTSDPSEVETLREEKRVFITEAFEFIESVSGTCDEVIISDKGIIAKGLTSGNEEMIETRKGVLESEINAKTRECDALTMITDEVRLKRIRLGKLQGKMGVIKVGGFGKGDLKAMKDAVDDTTRACEAAYRYGYTIGGSIAPCIAIGDIMTEDNFVTMYSELDRIIFKSFSDSFKKVFTKICTNKADLFTVELEDGTHDFTPADIIYRCIGDRVGFNILTNTFDTDCVEVLNPVNVDIEVLRGCLRLIILVVTSDQFIYKNYQDINVFDDESKPNIVELDSNVNTRISKRN